MLGRVLDRAAREAGVVLGPRDPLEGGVVESVAQRLLLVAANEF